MKNIFHKKEWNLGEKPAHVAPFPITLIKETYNGKV